MFLVLFIFQALAQPVIFQHPDTSQIAYEKHLLDNPGSQTYIQHLEKIGENNEKKLLSQLRSAQFSFLNGDLEKASEKFKKIIDQKHQVDWPKKSRQAIHFSHLRLAQLASSMEEKQKMLQAAFQWSSTTPINENTFPPPLVQSYRALAIKQKKKVFPLPKESRQFSQIMVNGQKISNSQSFLKMHPGTRRISFLSNKVQEFHVITKMENLETLKIPLRPMVKGNCQNPQLSGTVKELEIDTKIYSQSCGQTRPLILNTALTTPSAQPLPSRSWKFLKSKWFWIGTSIIATGFALNQLNQKSSSPNSPPQNTNQTPPVSQFSN